MKTLSDKVFNKVINMMANTPMTVERLSTILDADKDESIDAYFFGRLAGFDIKDKEALQALITGRAQRCICSTEVLQSVEIENVKIVSVGKIEISIRIRTPTKTKTVVLGMAVLSAHSLQQTTRLTASLISCIKTSRHNVEGKVRIKPSF